MPTHCFFFFFFEYKMRSNHLLRPWTGLVVAEPPPWPKGWPATPCGCIGHPSFFHVFFFLFLIFNRGWSGHPLRPLGWLGHHQTGHGLRGGQPPPVGGLATLLLSPFYFFIFMFIFLIFRFKILKLKKIIF
jgi:hypothetical protein